MALAPAGINKSTGPAPLGEKMCIRDRAFTAQAWTSLEREADLASVGYDLVQDPQQLSFFVTNDLRITLISQDGSVLFESATDQPMDCLLYTSASKYLAKHAMP